MPSTSQDVIDACTNILDGESVDDYKATLWLEARGYVLRRNWSWKVPEGHSPTQDELMMIRYLIEEWDYGSIES